MLGGRYRVGEELGRGGMAKVYRGEDTVLGRPVAIKILAPQYADDPNFVTRFRREAQAAARLSNQHVVSVFDTGSDDGVHYIVMEYVEGRTLADFLAGGGRIMPDRASEITIDVCDALSAAHAQGVIHRDIKPGNIMITPSGDVKVTDFGIARVTSTAETVAQTAAVLGTASYLSPEQAQGQPVDGRSDIYSLGCVLYEMVGGRAPFLGDSAVAVASKHVLEQPTPPSRLNADVSPDLDAVILRALAKNPDNRYHSAEEFRDDLERARRGLPVEATPLLAAGAAAGATRVISTAAPAPATQVLEPPPEEPKSRWWIPVLVTLGILALLGVFLWFLAQNVLNTNDNKSGNNQIAVPNVVGMSFFDARTQLENKGFTIGKPVRVPTQDPTVAEGTVLKQDPVAGQKVDRGTEVVLTVVGAPAQTAVPTIQPGATPDDATAALISAGLTPGDTVEQPSDTVPQGQVIGFDPQSGTVIDPSTPVKIIVSSGPSAVTVPSVTCLSFNAAQNRLASAGLNPVISSDSVAVNPACPHGNKVAQQDPGANASVDPGTTVTLYAGTESTPTGPTGGTGTTP
jgi:eukaryotic-like serine/threonine-protein kinase